jgi:hypothetical protein
MLIWLAVIAVISTENGSNDNTITAVPIPTEWQPMAANDSAERQSAAPWPGRAPAQRVVAEQRGLRPGEQHRLQRPPRPPLKVPGCP